MPDPIDAKAYYGYLFQKSKEPTKVLDQLLRGIANYISEHLGDANEKCLTPAKLAAFYKAVGGNYDSLFVDMPHRSISWIYASTGCQHTLQPTSDSFALPSIPALTTKGFVNWQSIEILLGPEEHVPFIQYAVANFPIINPDTGEGFPTDLSIEAFPLVPDTVIEKWHNHCAQRLRQRATPDEERRPDLPPRPPKDPSGLWESYRTGPAKRRPGQAQEGSRSKSDYFDIRPDPQPRRDIPFSHVPGVSVPSGRPVRPKMTRADPSRRAHEFLAPEALGPDSPRLSRSRRRSVPENMNSPGATPQASPDIRESPNHEHVRRHSHPRHARRVSISSDASSEGEEPRSPKNTRPRTYLRAEGPSIRFEYAPPTASPVSAHPSPNVRVHGGREGEEEERKRRSYTIPLDQSGKLSSPFTLGNREFERPRNSSKNGNVRWKDLSEVTERIRSKSSEEDRDPPPRRRVSRDDRDLDRSSGSDYKRRDRERDKVRDIPLDRDRDRDARPRVVRPSTSHEGSPREWDREREWEREGLGLRGVPDGRSFRERDRERRPVSPDRGVGGRFYPTAR